MALTLTGIALASLAAAGLLTVVAVGVSELFRGDEHRNGHAMIFPEMT